MRQGLKQITSEKAALKMVPSGAGFGGTYSKLGTIQRRFAWPPRKDSTQNSLI